MSGAIRSVLTGAAANIGSVVRGAAAQNADLEQWRDSADNKLLAVGYSGIVDFREQATPVNSPADRGWLFARDNGAGKTQLCVVFSSSAVQVLATQP